ncbi:hypothetical protein EVAR_44356_1 [Eumeta japonica]|uniref:Uncharacterized protein n=1 Tax=Eumeta variegata TaxID=151549 RepID=A0A4C1X5R1_EUMVA|nr:hypothetical protein EVAR_44356_1 [Eumeta japonica]
MARVEREPSLGGSRGGRGEVVCTHGGHISGIREESTPVPGRNFGDDAAAAGGRGRRARRRTPPTERCAVAGYSAKAFRVLISLVAFAHAALCCMKVQGPFIDPTSETLPLATYRGELGLKPPTLERCESWLLLTAVSEATATYVFHETRSMWLKPSIYKTTSHFAAYVSDGPIYRMDFCYRFIVAALYHEANEETEYSEYDISPDIAGADIIGTKLLFREVARAPRYLYCDLSPPVDLHITSPSRRCVGRKHSVIGGWRCGSRAPRPPPLKRQTINKEPTSRRGSQLQARCTPAALEVPALMKHFHGTLVGGSARLAQSDLPHE